MVIELLENEFDEKIKETCVVDFSTSSCPACVMLSPVFEKVSHELDIPFYSVNLENAMSLAQRFSIMYVPTVIVFKDGNAAAVKTGALSENELTELIKGAM